MTYNLKNCEIYILIISKYLIYLFSDNEGGMANKINYQDHFVLNIAENKDLFSKVIIITPNISKKTKLIITLKKAKETPKIILKMKKKDIRTLINKKAAEKLVIKSNLQSPKKAKQKTEKHKYYKKEKTIRTYKLQKKKTAPIAIFSATIAFIFTVSLALLNFKKLIHKMFVVTPAIILKKKNVQKQSHRLTKKYHP